MTARNKSPREPAPRPFFFSRGLFHVTHDRGTTYSPLLGVAWPVRHLSLRLLFCITRIFRGLDNRQKFVCIAKIIIITTYSTIVREDSGLELVWRARVNDYSVTRLEFYGFGDVLKLFVIPSDGVFTVVSDVLTCAVAQQTEEWQLTGKFHVLDLETSRIRNSWLVSANSVAWGCVSLYFKGFLRRQ